MSSSALRAACRRLSRVALDAPASTSYHREWGAAAVRRRPALVPLLFCAANLRHPAKMRAHNAVVCLLIAVISELISDLGGSSWAWGAIAPPAVVAFGVIPLYLLLMRWFGAPSAALQPFPDPSRSSQP